jgi:hypothetical protein
MICGSSRSVEDIDIDAVVSRMIMKMMILIMMVPTMI